MITQAKNIRLTVEDKISINLCSFDRFVYLNNWFVFDKFLKKKLINRQRVYR